MYFSAFFIWVIFLNNFIVSKPWPCYTKYLKRKHFLPSSFPFLPPRSFSPSVNLNVLRSLLRGRISRCRFCSRFLSFIPSLLMFFFYPRWYVKANLHDLFTVLSHCIYTLHRYYLLSR